MFKPLEMSKVIIIGSTKLLDQTIETLHDLNILHITDFREETDPYFKIGKPLEKATYTSEKLLKLRSISNYLGISEVPVERKLKVEELARNLDKQLVEIDTKVSELLEKRNKIESELKDLAAKEAEIEPFASLPLEFQLYRGYANLSVYTGFIRADIEPKVQEITKEYELFTGSFEGQKVIALFVPKQFEAKIAEVLMGAGFQEIPVPEYDGLPEKILNECKQKGEALLAEKTKIEEEIVKFKEQYATFILASEEYLSIETQKAEAPLRFATTANSFIIDGWVPTEKFELLQSSIEKATDGRVYVQKLEIYEKAHEEHPHAAEMPSDIPVEYKNPEPAKPLQLICDLFSRPTYDEIDPTGIIFITYPLLFGIILGDIAYGAMILAMGVFIKLKSKEEWLKWLGTIGIYAGIFSIIMGMVYAEIFGPNFDPITSHGAIHVGGFVWHAIIDRAEGEGIKMLLGVTILVGVVHLIIGLFAGFRNEIKHHGLKKALLEKLSWVVLLIGGVLAGLKAVPAMIEKHPMPTSDPVFLAGGVIAIVGVIMVVLGEGGMGLVHIPGIMSNCLSYTRLCAVGLSSVFIAYATNMMAIDMCIKAHPGDVVFLILGLFAFISMHALNALLGILAPGLHALRLHYVEFFTKFYKGGGKKYSPFGYIRKYTEE